MSSAIVSRKEVDLTQDNDPAQDSDASVIYVRTRRMRPAGVSNLVAKLCSVNPIKIQVAVAEVPDRRGRTHDVKVYAYPVEVGRKVVLYYRYGVLPPNCRDIIQPPLPDDYARNNTNRSGWQWVKPLRTALGGGAGRRRGTGGSGPLRASVRHEMIVQQWHKKHPNRDYNKADRLPVMYTDT
ncbi:unnamed protein product [Zymoseptoria tritici ST99CH_1E4]|uniref:Uncharacterized protein n=2 Tax=Zymoseptoria tritici TaxID=1047171 RepID=F9XQQ2_ZYMTI|nr:uncharacterized protein MYCGRDRAFT_97586 [Zymoseptoria tritici IPO323]EGP82445.1 hypothetical protein MYCGRDRAFT_97586 [Zymoseptoria tritici IPO323]SMR62269.1 unnamed protein product [Zymoseptoria tritici ST99CH_1E4]